MHPFLVPLRDAITHHPLPGIEIGDIGPKLGCQTVDNGYLAMHSVRIPLKNLLARFGKVSPDGAYISTPNSKIRYFVMMITRANLLYDFPNALAKAVTIAIRYSAVRGTLKYEAQQHKLFFALAAAVSMKVLSIRVRHEVVTAQDHLEQVPDARLKILHTNTSGLKALYSMTLIEELETCRQSCGGHGYSLFSGLPSLYANWGLSVTIEGENSVMLQQCGNRLLKTIRGVRGEVPTELQYLTLSRTNPKCLAQQENDWENLALIEEALVVRATALARQLLETYSEAAKAGHSPLEIANEIAQKATVDLALAHCELITFQEMKHVTESQVDPPFKAILANLARIYTLTLIKRGSMTLYEVDYFDFPQPELLLDTIISKILAEINPVAIQLVDSFAFTDNALNSALGVYSGKVYETLFDWALRYGDKTPSLKLKERMMSKASKL